MSVVISVSGVDKIDKVLRGMPVFISDTLLLNVHSKAAEPLVQRAKLLAPLGKTGNLTKSVGIIKEGIKKSDQLGLVKVGPRRGGNYKGYHGHLLEFGKTNRDGTRTRPRPFMRPAFNQTKDQVERIIIYQISKQVSDYIKKGVK